ncbi:hypothetical protein Tco_0444313, partial [Tanacetum coccineum]
GGSSLAKSSDDFSIVDGVLEDSDAVAASPISIMRFAVTVRSSTLWAARGRVPVFTFVGFEALIRFNKSISAFIQNR